MTFGSIFGSTMAFCSIFSLVAALAIGISPSFPVVVVFSSVLAIGHAASFPVVVVFSASTLLLSVVLAIGSTLLLSRLLLRLLRGVLEADNLLYF